MKIGKTWDYDAATNKWITIDDSNDSWFVAFIHTLKSDPAQHLTYADHGVSALDALQNNIVPTLDITRTVQQFSPYFAQLLVTQKSAIEPVYNVFCQYLDGRVNEQIINLRKYQ
jgi:di/tripeptidase